MPESSRGWLCLPPPGRTYVRTYVYVCVRTRACVCTCARKGETGDGGRGSIHSRDQRVASVECVPFNIAEHYISPLLSLRCPYRTL